MKLLEINTFQFRLSFGSSEISESILALFNISTSSSPKNYFKVIEYNLLSIIYVKNLFTSLIF